MFHHYHVTKFWLTEILTDNRLNSLYVNTQIMPIFGSPIVIQWFLPDNRRIDTRYCRMFFSKTMGMHSDCVRNHSVATSIRDWRALSVRFRLPTSSPIIYARNGDLLYLNICDIFDIVFLSPHLVTPTWFEHAAFWSGVRRLRVRIIFDVFVATTIRTYACAFSVSKVVRIPNSRNRNETKNSVIVISFLRQHFPFRRFKIPLWDD